METYDGRCLCGDVRFRAIGAPKWVLWCHCQSCRRHSGAPASVFVSFAHEQVSMLAGEIAKYGSSPGVERGFCARCGSTLTCSNARLPNETHFHVGAFERAADLAPMGELFGGERLPWFEPRTGALGGVAAMAAIALARGKKARERS
ncbi:MAG: GFA family protein [Proteobacteria bacterium]|nr:GFA family protein [Pseudomonadota bacterium]